VFVVAGGEAAPVFEGFEGAFDDVAPTVGVLVEGDGASSGRAGALAVGFLVVGFGDNGTAPSVA
jgi:hypothetical protein